MHKAFWKTKDGTELAALIAAGVLLLLLFVVLVGQGSAPSMPKPGHKTTGKKPPAKPYQFPNGGRQLLPDYRLVALYGTMEYPALGALGEQPLQASIDRAKALAAQYQPLTSQHVLPTLEIITTLASGSPTDNGDYSQELDMAKIQPWVDAARAQGVYVVLDLQPGRSDFLTQAKQYQPLLQQPNVGLALDPEWRLGPDQLPLQQIGSAGIDEINQTSLWLSDITTKNKLPQKLFLLHQFRLDMLPGREQLDTSHKNLAYVIQMDGSGSQPQKLETWTTITANAPAGVSFGWKNFYRQDSPMLDPAGTMALTPAPAYVSYQ